MLYAQAGEEGGEAGTCKKASRVSDDEAGRATLALREAVRTIGASWYPRPVVVSVVDVVELEFDAGAAAAAPRGEAPHQRASRLANLAMRRAVLPETAGEAMWRQRLAFAELPATTEPPALGLFEIVASEWAGAARPAPLGEVSPYAAWCLVDANRFRPFFIDAMIQNDETGEVGVKEFVEREDVLTVEHEFFAALGEDEAPPLCVLAADLARGSLPDVLDFDKAFVAVGSGRVAAMWIYMGRIWG
jgi:hypothetical protein